ncbi:permease-like cell division protein FtsX [Anaeropeptidivorans aminofermentans]|jgi:cell division transport system permease protein|uniref:permease-like cell division protein FtsX n=1 Tax=Anaeropeptidivorans aminofermentans TaxID=2934315 RepID=UPI0020243B93|nr:permease-like cell division protein FtsX [Anaeropeptidivorans aminofermentans]MBE6013501.1 ABC transporter permease [Lachnospiraceae bacterium]
MKLRNMKYYFRESISSIIRNRLMSVASIITVACCILILGFSYCIVSNLDYILKNLESEMMLSVYVMDSYDEDKIEELKSKILSIEHVTGTDYISSKEAMENFAKTYGSDDEENFFTGLEDSEDNILPRSFDIQVDDIENQEYVKNELEKMVGEELEKVKYDKESIDVIIGINNIIRIASIIIILFLGLVSVIIIMNTIKLTVNNRKIEINIMKYVGATDSFIRWPFIIEGMIIGLIGAAIPTALCWFSYGKAIDLINANIPALTSLVEFKSVYSVFAVLIPFSLVLGVIIGAIGSVTSIKRHLLV